ncbi:ROK family protein [Patescibacteria group bacterium]|nr:ROK family protein [Patescibacteria group bacterium]
MFLLFDIGGTKMRLAISSDGESVGKPEIVKTPQSFEEGMEVFKNAFAKIVDGVKIEKSAGGIAGIFDGKKERLTISPNLPQWENKPLKERLESVVGCPVFLENDADLAGLGEAKYGAGRNCSIVAYLTIGTGVGGSRIVNGKIDSNTSGFEPGHQIIKTDSSISGRVTSLEELVSGGGLEKRFGKNPEDINDEKIWEETERYLTYGINNTIVHWSPEVVILGGGLIESGRISIEKIALQLSKVHNIFPKMPEIKKAELGDLGGLHGALAYLKQL